MTIRVVIDTNIWISSVLVPTGYPAQLIGKWQEDKFKLVISDPLLEEFIGEPRGISHIFPDLPRSPSKKSTYRIVYKTYACQDKDC